MIPCAPVRPQIDANDFLVREQPIAAIQPEDRTVAHKIQRLRGRDAIPADDASALQCTAANRQTSSFDVLRDGRDRIGRHPMAFRDRPGHAQGPRLRQIPRCLSPDAKRKRADGGRQPRPHQCAEPVAREQYNRAAPAGSCKRLRMLHVGGSKDLRAATTGNLVA